MKYSRTYHVYWSPGATDDDKILPDVNCFIGKEIVMTEKLDGECTGMSRDLCHARSLDSNNHPSRSWVKGLWGNIRHEIPPDWKIFGENVFAKHSIHYTNLRSYFYVFSIFDGERFMDWQSVREVCYMLGLEMVPVLWSGMFDLEFVKNFHNTLDLTNQEGYVIRNVESFSPEDFSKNVAKWVRNGHVQTNEHWMNQPIIKNMLR